MDFREFVRFLRTYLWLLVITTLLGAATGATLALTLPKTYVGTTQVVFSTSAAGTQTGQDLTTSAQYLLLRMPTYMALASTRAVLDPVISVEHLATTSTALADDVTASVAAGTTVLTISVSQPTARRAQAVSATVARSMINLLTNRSGGATAFSVPAQVTAGIASAPTLPSSPSSPSLLLDVVAGILVGLVVGLSIALVRWLRRRWAPPRTTSRRRR